MTAMVDDDDNDDDEETVYYNLVGPDKTTAAGG
jgi:hypothetical protein